MISMNYGTSTSSWKPWRWGRFDLILMIWDVYINSSLNPLTKFISSSRSTEFKDILLWNMSLMITKIIPITTRIVISYAMERGILFWDGWKVNGNWDNNMIRIPQRRESHCRTNTSVRRKIQIQKSRTMRAIFWDSSRKVNQVAVISRHVSTQQNLWSKFSTLYVLLTEYFFLFFETFFLQWFTRKQH